MNQRRPLVDGLKNQASPVDPDKEKAFVFGGKIAAPQEAPNSPVPTGIKSAPAMPSRVPLSTRMRGDFAAALKRTSLERQLGGVEPNSLQDILEQAVEPWLRSNGYLQ